MATEEDLVDRMQQPKRLPSAVVVLGVASVGPTHKPTLLTVVASEAASLGPTLKRPPSTEAAHSVEDSRVLTLQLIPLASARSNHNQQRPILDFPKFRKNLTFLRCLFKTHSDQSLTHTCT
jgi:hypothetical protein